MRDASLAALQRATEHAFAYISSLDTHPVAATATLAGLRERLGVPLGDHGLAPEQVIDELVTATEGGHLGSAGGRFFGWVMGGALPSALAADWLVSTWDNNAALYPCGPAAAVVEEVAGAWLKDVLGLPPQASFAFTTGCQMAHLTCLAAARHAVLHQAGWDVEQDGLAGSPPIRILATDHHHASVIRAIRLLGLGTRALSVLPTDAGGRLEEATLEAALAVPRVPTILVLNAGDLNQGACDPFDRLIPLARAAGAWVHIDGAFGLWARASRSYRHLVESVDLADSWATDAHKWLNTPNDIGLAFVCDNAAHRAAMTVSASYLVTGGDARDQIDWTPDWTRRARGYPVYAALRELGRDGVEALIDRCCSHARAIAQGLATMPGVVLAAEPTLNQGLVRLLDPAPGATEDDHDRRTDTVIAAVNASGEAFFSGASWRGRRVMRISVVNWRTSSDDVRRTLAAVEKVLE